jgi:tRNA 2-thiouridine synthesizing protein A
MRGDDLSRQFQQITPSLFFGHRIAFSYGYCLASRCTCRAALPQHICVSPLPATGQVNKIMASLQTPEEQPMDEAADREIDITAETCPMTFVRTRLALDRMAPGAVLDVLVKGEEPRRNIPRTAQEQGHQVLAMQEEPGGVIRLRLRKAAG